MFQFTLGDGTSVQGDGNLDPNLPLVVLLHGLGGTSLDMTAPMTSRAAVAFDRTASFPLYKDEGLNFSPPIVPVARFYLDPPKTPLTSWSDALVRAGFSTLSYTQLGGPLAPDVTQLTRLVTEALSGAPTRMGAPNMSGLRIAFLAHSRGGLVARAFLVAAATNPALSGFVGRVKSLITLHSPHFGSGVASLAATVDGLLASLQTGFASLGVPPPAFLAMLRSTTGSPVIGELAPGSPTTGIMAGEPVPGVTYHTFGGSSTAFARLWADVYAPNSTFPLWPFPLWRWGSVPHLVGTPLDIVSFAPVAPILTALPIVQQIMATLTVLVATTPEFAPGSGDVLVTDASAHLPFSTTRTTNPLNHAEALWDNTLQAQVVAILSRLRNPTLSGIATARLSPHPARTTLTTYTVTANDAVTGAALSSGTVTVRDTHGQPVLTRTGLPASFPYKFASRTVSPPNRVPVTLWPTVALELPSPYSTTISVDTGRKNPF